MTYRTGVFLAQVAMSAVVLAAPACAADFEADLGPASHDNSTCLRVQDEGVITGTLAGNRLTPRNRLTGLITHECIVRV